MIAVIFFEHKEPELISLSAKDLGESGGISFGMDQLTKSRVMRIFIAKSRSDADEAIERWGDERKSRILRGKF
jgi:hypothetical protein